MFPEPAEVPTQAGRHAEKQDIQYVAHTYRHTVEKHEEATWKETTFWSFIRWPYLLKCFQTQRLFKCSIVLRDNVLHHSILTIYTAKTVATRLRGPFHLTQSIPNFQFSKHFNDTIHNSRWWLAADLLPNWSVLNERWRNMTDECCSYISSPLFLSASSSLSYIYRSFIVSYHHCVCSVSTPVQGLRSPLCIPAGSKQVTDFLGAGTGTGAWKERRNHWWSGVSSCWLPRGFAVSISILEMPYSHLGCILDLNNANNHMNRDQNKT